MHMYLSTFLYLSVYHCFQTYLLLNRQFTVYNNTTGDSALPPRSASIGYQSSINKTCVISGPTSSWKQSSWH